MNLVEKAINRIWYHISGFSPRWRAQYKYHYNFGRLINWSNPTEMNEKIRWCQFYTDTSKWSILADKYRVREYVADHGYSDLLVKLYGKWDRAEDIDFEALPDSFVIKTNHGCGSVFIVKNKREVDLEKIRTQLKADLGSKFGKENAEMHYKSIRPVVIAEELLIQDNDVSSTLIDYKCYVTGGVIRCVAVMYNRNGHLFDETVYDSDWNRNDGWKNNKISSESIEIPKPVNFDLMKQFCKDMCSEFPFVRMDFYETGGRLYLGEFTFTPGACGYGIALNEKAADFISSNIELPIKQRK